ncbi:hypothetical protein Nepgr_017911 [Nepenthes gracilis]|uniref:Uncharacterized protein n=1 Tax=Nepenthes gracilis TaxID=150966 RepID=A0AAD3SQ98_NEPGR|nr:hypothetical protein Nepgr_017911 [Nepenthes gracilis]
MARSLSQTLDRVALLSQSISSRSPPNRLLNSRNRSNQSEKSSQIGLELGSDTDMDRISIQKLQDAVHWIIIKRAQPDWLPFVPGASYWVPPKSKARGFTDVISKLSVSIIKDEVISFNTNHGWPLSEYYFEGASQSPLEIEMSCKQTSQSEDEEG